MFSQAPWLPLTFKPQFYLTSPYFLNHLHHSITTVQSCHWRHPSLHSITWNLICHCLLLSSLNSLPRSIALVLHFSLSLKTLVAIIFYFHLWILCHLHIITVVLYLCLYLFHLNWLLWYDISYCGLFCFDILWLIICGIGIYFCFKLLFVV